MKRWFVAGFAAAGIALTVAPDTAQAQFGRGGFGRSGIGISFGSGGAGWGNPGFGYGGLGYGGYGYGNRSFGWGGPGNFGLGGPGNWGSGYGGYPGFWGGRGSGISLSFGNAYSSPGYGYGYSPRFYGSSYSPGYSYSTPSYSGFAMSPSYSSTPAYYGSSLSQGSSMIHGSSLDYSQSMLQGSSMAYGTSGFASGGPIVSSSMGQCHDSASGVITASGLEHQQHGALSGSSDAPSVSGYTPSADKVSLVVRVSDANAEVKINGQATKSDGMERHFVSPSLEPGNYQYEVSVRMTNAADAREQKRTVSVKPGDFKTVDFTSATGGARDLNSAPAERLPAADRNPSRDLNQLDRDRDRDNDRRDRDADRTDKPALPGKPDPDRND